VASGWRGAKSPGVSDVAVGVCLRGRVRLGGHYPSERREGRMDVDVDVDGFILVFFAHV
jgi:predicted aconitase